MSAKYIDIAHSGASPDSPLESVRTIFANALGLHQKGQLPQAKVGYEQVLEIQPRHFDALHLLGVIAKQTNNPELAIDLMGKAIEINPDVASAYYNRGLALRELKQFDAAIGSYDKAIALKPDYPDAYYSRGNALQEAKQFDAAVTSYDRAIALKPDYVEAYANRGTALQALTQLAAAIASYDKAIALKPDYAGAYSNRGVALKELKQLDAAIASYDKAIALKPDYAEAYSNRGVALKELRQLNAALASYDKAIALKPDYAEAHSNRGVALKELKQLDAAIASCDKAIALKPDYADAYYNRGNALQDLNQLDAAIASFDRAIAIDPGYSEAYWNKSLSLLLGGDFEKGWELYEWRWERKEREAKPNLMQPLWLGAESIEGQIILLHSEQGLGDTIQFCRYVKLVSDLGANVILEVEEPLIAMLSNLAGVSQVVAKGSALPTFDVHCPLMSLPLAFKTTLATIPSAQAYLPIDSGKVTDWAGKLGAKGKPRVGLVWSGRPAHVNDRNRSLDLSRVISYLPGNFEYFSLQKELREADQATLQAHPDIRHFGAALNDFSETAALCGQMDLVISVDTSIAHLSAAIGKPTWVLLPYVPDWRWLLNRDDSPWYPSARLFRQRAVGDWASVLAEVKAALTGSLTPNSHN